MGVGRVIGTGFQTARDALARLLIAVGVRPNTLTLTGLAFTVSAGVCLALVAGDCLTEAGARGRWLGPRDEMSGGVSAWNLWAFGLLILASATDMLDGAVARIGNLATRFGGFLDSTIDRVSDFAIFAGIGAYYAWRGNVTLTLLAMLCFANAFTISGFHFKINWYNHNCAKNHQQRHK